MPTTTRSASIGIGASAGPRTATISSQGADSGADAPAGGSPAPGHADGQHDGERFHHLHRGGGEGREGDQDIVHVNP